MDCVDSSYLAGRHELERAECALQVWDVGLKVVESIGDAGLNLRGRLPRWAVWRDLVQGGGRHGVAVCRKRASPNSRVQVEISLWDAWAMQHVIWYNSAIVE